METIFGTNVITELFLPKILLVGVAIHVCRYGGICAELNQTSGHETSYGQSASPRVMLPYSQ